MSSVLERRATSAFKSAKSLFNFLYFVCLIFNYSTKFLNSSFENPGPLSFSNLDYFSLTSLSN